MNTTLVPAKARHPLRHLHPLRDLGEAWRRLRFRHLVRHLSEQIHIDLRETPQAYTVLAALPGASKGDIDVTVEGNRVHIRSAASAEHAQHEGSGILRRERYVGQRQRTLTLAHEIDRAMASAEYRHGVLRLVLPKVLQERGVRVPVQ